MGRASYNVQLKPHTQILFILFCSVCIRKSAYLPSKKKKPP